MEDSDGLKDEPICLEIPHREYIKTVVLLLILATLIGLASQVASAWFGNAPWLMVIWVLDGALFAFAALLFTDCIPARQPVRTTSQRTY